MKRTSLFLGISIAAFSIFFNIMLNGCSSGSYEITTKFVTSKWQLEKLNGSALTLTDTKQVTLEINAEAGNAAGQAPCNKYSCSYDQYNDEIKFNTITSTKMACDDLGKESEYYTMLGTITKYKVSGDKLFLYAGSKIVAEFSKLKP